MAIHDAGGTQPAVLVAAAWRRGLTRALGREVAMQQGWAFLRTLTIPAWVCFLVAISGLFMSAYAWLPLAHSNRMVVFAGAAAMVAGLIAFMSVAGHHLIAWEYRKSPQPRVRLPRCFWIAAAAALFYFLLVFLGAAVVYPRSADPGHSVHLRIFSAGALFLGVASLGFTQWAGLRVRALRSVR